MELLIDKPVVESTGIIEEQSFSIEDQGMIFDILRNKMYSDPIRAICREITCNARDAHREVGKADIPIHIQLPSALQPNLVIKDFGPGITFSLNTQLPQRGHLIFKLVAMVLELKLHFHIVILLTLLPIMKVQNIITPAILMKQK